MTYACSDVDLRVIIGAPACACALGDVVTRQIVEHVH